MEDGAADLDAVRAQLGRPPRGPWRVARRCRCELPQVIQTHPRLSDGTPFPTLWWVTCRALVDAIARAESEGGIARINRRLQADDSFRAALITATERYVASRDSIEVLGTRTHPGGGPDRVKCLHAHTADHLVSGANPVGEEVLRLLAWTDPDTRCV